MEYVTYKNIKVPIKTIPKGSLLFRLGANENDFRGVPKKNGTRCILSNHNVFFYPNPFAGKAALYDFKDSDFSRIGIYVLTHDIQVVWLLNPSPFTRRSKNAGTGFLKRCYTVRKGCVDIKSGKGLHARYNPCFDEEFIAKYPNIVGMIANAFGDSEKMSRTFPHLPPYKKKFFHFAEDAEGVRMIPELILHPLKRRPRKDIIVYPNDILENNYEPIANLSVEKDQTKLVTFMNRHAKYNPETFFYQIK
uniref:Uncharacterized protein n=1 Tax=viral metagenome TaxID=1070528 RepID=A0A6C0JZY1_9ZZZZ